MRIRSSAAMIAANTIVGRLMKCTVRHTHSYVCVCGWVCLSVRLFPSNKSRSEPACGELSASAGAELLIVADRVCGAREN